MSAVFANDEAQKKKNTDCVYFLASPLTCKKGVDCEFRHSESARNNPRDCWYWLSGACLNANCAFRHPPLEGLLEGDAVAGAVKSRVPCYYFMQGYCVKGDKCTFMHGLPAGTTAEISQKPSKHLVPKTEVLGNQTSANKGNGSVTSRASFEYHETPNDVQVVGDTDVNRMPEGSDSSVPSRSRPPQSTASEGLKKVQVSNGRLHQVDILKDKFLHQEAQIEEDDFQPPYERFGEDPSGEDQIHNATESEEIREESSFDVLVDDGATDQLIYADDLDYINSCDAIVDQLRGAAMLGAEGFVDYDYDHAGAYGQYYDASEYELATYDSYEQPLVYEHLTAYDHNDGMQPVVDLRNRPAKDMLPHDRRHAPFDGNNRPATVSSNDLRNHIVKRRRAEKNQKFGEDHPRRRHQGNGYQHSRRHQEGHLKQQEVISRHHNSQLEQQEVISRHHNSQPTGSRSNRQFQGRGESSGGRQFYGRLGESIGAKRPYRDLTLDHEETSMEQGSGKKFQGMGEGLKGKTKKERGRLCAPRADEALGKRGHLGQHNKKAEMQKVDSSFAGPKSLAQIKAEKMKAMGEGSFSEWQESNALFSSSHIDSAKQRGPQMRSRSEGSANVSKELGKPSKSAVPKEADFEGPKPLSVILKQKRREEGNGEAKGQMHKKPLGPDSDMLVAANRVVGGVKSIILSPNNSESLRVNQSEARAAEVQRNHDESGFHLQDPASFASCLPNNKGKPLDLQANRLDGDNPVFDTQNGADMGDCVMEDIEFEDDEDDFAKRLGGFFS